MDWVAWLIIFIIGCGIWEFLKKKVLNDEDGYRRDRYDSDWYENRAVRIWDSTDIFSVDATLEITYKGSKGRKSDYLVDVDQAGYLDDGGIISGHCQSRKTGRNYNKAFLTERIVDCVDADTGEAVSDIMEYLRDKYEALPYRSLDRLSQEEGDAIKVLLYVGKADGRLITSERGMIQDACRRLVGDDRITDDDINKVLKDINVPSLQTFRVAVGKVAKRGGASVDILLETAEALVDAEKTVHPAEKAALDYMRKRFDAEKKNLVDA